MPQNQNNTLVKALHKRGVHFVLCRAKDDGAKKAKSAIAARWQSQAAALKSTITHHAAGGLLGFVPGRSGLWVLDIDNEQNVDAIRAGLGELAAQALAVIPSRRGAHVYFKKNSGEVRNRQWAVNGLNGDVRGDRGYVIAWDLDRLAAALDKLPTAIPTPDSAFPKGGKAGPVLIEGGRNDGLNRLVFAKAQAGQTEFREERATAIAAGLDVAEVDATIKSASGAATDRTFTRKDATALEGALSHLGISVRYNIRAQSSEVSSDGGQTWERTSDRKTADLRRLIADGFSYRLADKRGIAPLRYGLDSWGEHLNALLYHHETDPFLDWLKSLPIWDSKKRLHRLLTDTLQAADGPLTRWASTYLCLGAVQRGFEPGCLLREIPILISPQRAGKSSLLSNLLPPEHPDWFSDSISMADPTQKRVESMLGRVIVELSELTGFARAELESLKAFISRRDDGATRLAYRRDPETTLRRSILVGTSNDVECLPNDPSGNTRFVPIQCGAGSHVEPFLAKHRVQLWAEALATWRESGGEARANLPRNLMSLQSDRAELHRRKDQILEDGVAAIDGDGPYSLGELCHLVSPGITLTDARATRRLGDALRLAGWEKRRERTATGLPYLWRKDG